MENNNTLSSNLERIKSATDDLRELVSMTEEDTIEDVVAEVQKQIPSSVELKDVNFYDWDGTFLFGYTKQEFLALEELPPNPEYEEFTAQGWNAELSDAKEYVTKYGCLNIGQTVTTKDGKTRIYITLDDENLLSPYINIKVNGTVSLNFGDGSETVNITGTGQVVYTKHTYPRTGDYIIEIGGETPFTIGYTYGWNTTNTVGFLSVSDDDYSFSAYQGAIRRLYFGANSSIGYCGIRGLNKIEKMNIPLSLNIDGTSYHGLAAGSSKLNLVLPKTKKNILQSELEGLGLVIFPPKITGTMYRSSIKNIGRSDANLTLPEHTGSSYIVGNIGNFTCKKLIVPDSWSAWCPDGYDALGSTTAEYIRLSNNMNYTRNTAFFSDVKGIKSLDDIENWFVPNKQTFNGSLFKNSGIMSVDLPNETTSIGTECFSGSLLSHISMSNNVISLGNKAFSGCRYLTNITLSDNITTLPSECFSSCSSLIDVHLPVNLTTISNRAFYNCQSLKYLYIPKSVNSIGTDVFYGCYQLEYLDFSDHDSVPTLSGSLSSWPGPSNYKVIVPDELYDSWRTANQWSSISNKIIRKSDYDSLNE